MLMEAFKFDTHLLSKNPIFQQVVVVKKWLCNIHNFFILIYKIIMTMKKMQK